MPTHNPLSSRDLDDAATLEEDGDDEKNAAPNDIAAPRETLSGVRALLLPAAPLLAVACVAGFLGLIAVLLVAGSTGKRGHDLVDAWPRTLSSNLARVAVCTACCGVGGSLLDG